MINQKSIAVLPFKNISSDPENEYFADGMTEELINALSKINGLKVTARTSSFVYKNKQVDVRHVGNNLGVSTVLEGSIRKAKDAVRITAQLIRTDNGFHIWSESFDRKLENIFELQDEVSLLIVDKIRENFGHIEIEEQLVKSQTHNIEAYQYYLKGRFYQLNWKLEDFSTAIEFYKQSIKLDPNYFQPFFGIVQCYSILASWNFMNKENAIEEAGKYLEDGMAIRDKSAEGFLTLATHSFWVNWDVQAGLSHLNKGFQLSPNNTEALEAAAECYTAIGEFDKALIYINKALEYNPLSANHHYTKGNIFYLKGQFDEAITWMNKSLDIDPQWDLALQVKLSCFILTRNKTSLVEMIDRLLSFPNKQDFILLYEVINEKKEAREEDFAKDHTVYLPWEVYIPLYLGETQKAIEALKFGITNRLGQYINFLNDPFLAPLKENSTFQHLVKKTFKGKISQLNIDKELTIDTPTFSPSEALIYKAQLLSIMEEEAPYLNTELTLRSLAETIDLHPNKLSRLLNEEVGKNFNDFVNGYRLKAFQTKAVDPSNSHLTLLGLAYESGYNSKSVFNDFFKKATGLTPKAWVKANMKKS